MSQTMRVMKCAGASGMHHMWPQWAIAIATFSRTRLPAYLGKTKSRHEGQPKKKMKCREGANNVVSFLLGLQLQDTEATTYTT
jgi:hypothetical protein